MCVCVCVMCAASDEDSVLNAAGGFELLSFIYSFSHIDALKLNIFI